MKAWVVLCALLLVGASVQAQSGSGTPLRLKFKFGRVVLASGDTLDGPVALQFSPDLLYLVRPDGTVRTFAPATVAACAAQGEMLDPMPSGLAPTPRVDPRQVRLFRTLSWRPNRGNARAEPAFFEQLCPGKVLLLRRQYLMQRSVAFSPAPTTVGQGVFGVPVASSRGLPPPASPRYGTITEARDSYFLALSTGEVRALRTAKKDMLEALPAQANQLMAYAQTKRIGFGSARELAELVNYANSLLTSAIP